MINHYNKLFDRFRSAPLSYHYSINPSIVILGENLLDLKRHLNKYSLFGLSDELTGKGYSTLPESFAPDEVAEITGEPTDSWNWFDGLVVSLGWTSEREGLQGIVSRFTSFVELIGYNLPHKVYVITDDYDRQATIEVTSTGCVVSY